MGVDETLFAAAERACRAFCRLTLGDVVEENSPASGRGEFGTEENEDISTPVKEEVIRRSRIENASVRTVCTSSQI